MKCRYFCRLPLDISPVYLTRGISNYVGFFIFTKSEIEDFVKNRQNGKHAEGTVAGVSFCLPGVQRAGSPLCQECKGWQHLAGVKGQSP